MADISKATPRPWRIAENRWNLGNQPWREAVGIEEDAPDVQRLAVPGLLAWLTRPDGDANAALIVRAVNLHDELVAALREAALEVAQSIADIVGARKDNLNGIGHPNFDEASQQELARLEALMGRIRAVIEKGRRAMTTALDRAIRAACPAQHECRLGTCACILPGQIFVALRTLAEPDEAGIEAAALGIWASDAYSNGGSKEWDAVDRDYCFTEARAAITAHINQVLGETK